MTLDHIAALRAAAQAVGDTYTPDPLFSTFVVFEAQFVSQGIQPGSLLSKTILLTEDEWVGDSLWINPLCFTGDSQKCGAQRESNTIVRTVYTGG